MTTKKAKPLKRGPSLTPADKWVVGSAVHAAHKGVKKGTAIRAAVKETAAVCRKTPDGEELDYHVNRLSKAYAAFAKHAGKTIGVSGRWRKDPKRSPQPPKPPAKT